MDIKRIVLGFFAAAAVLVGCQEKEEDFGVAKIEVSTTALSFNSSSSSQTLQVTASRQWTVTGLPDWIAVDPAGGEPSKSPQTVTVTVIANDGFDREADVAFSIGLMKEYVKVSQTGQKGQIDYGKGTLEHPFSVDGVISYINSLDNPSTDSPEKVYVKGIISSVGEEYTAQYGNGTFDISDDGTTGSTQFKVYRAKYLGNKNYTSKDTQIKVGDEVIVYGNVVLYGSSAPVYETSQGNAYLYSLNGVTGSSTPAGDPKGTGSKEDPFNVAAALKTAAGLSWTSSDTYEKLGPFYVKGKISQIKEEYGTEYGNGTFYISDDGSTDNEFYVFRALYLGNKKFADGDTQIKVGDEVVIYGEIMNYRNNTPETVQNSSYLYSLNGETGGETPPAPPAGDAKGTGTQADPYNPAAAINAVKDLTWTDNTTYDTTSEVYVKGKISRIPEKGTFTEGGTYGNASFYISEDGSQAGEFYCYRVLYLGNKKFEAGQTDIKVGDEVVVYGQLMNYKGNTPETVANKAYLYSLNGETGGDTPPTPPAGETDHGATTIANFLAASESTSDWYELTGTISNLKADDQYGNFDLTDDSGTVYVYGVLSTKGGEKKKFQELVEKYGIANGGTITIKANRGSYQGKDEALNAYFVSYNGHGGDTPQPPAGDVEHGATTIANFLAAAESTSDWYELTGTISNLKDGDQYGNFDLTDDSGSVYVYGVLSTKGGEKKKFQELVEKYGIANGGTITIKANRGSYQGKDEALNAYFVSYNGQGGDTPGGGETTGDYASNVKWTLGESAYDNEATVNGTSGVAVLKLGTSSKVGTATVTIPAGTKKISFYGVSWKGKETSVAFKTGGEIVYKQALKDNEGAANNSPFTLTVSDADHYTYTLSEAPASAVDITLTTDGSNTRVILFGIKAE